MKCLKLLKHSFDLGRTDQIQFWKSEWEIPYIDSESILEVSKKYILYRLVFSSFFIVLFILDLVQHPEIHIFFLYFTNWTLALQLIYSLIYLFRLFWVLNCSQNAINNISTNNRLQWPEQIIWVVYNIVSTIPYIVSIGYWGLLFRPAIHSKQIISMMVHAMTAIMALLDSAVVAIPVRKIHMIFPILVVLTYGSFSLIYHVSSGPYSKKPVKKEYIYPFLNWKRHPKIACIITIGSVFFVGIVYIIFCWGLFWCRRFIKKHCVQKPQKPQKSQSNLLEIEHRQLDGSSINSAVGLSEIGDISKNSSFAIDANKMDSVRSEKSENSPKNIRPYDVP